MNKVEFMSKLNELLKVNNEDKKYILEEYETYFVEATLESLSEYDIINTLETPEEIAANANNEFGTESTKDDFKEFQDSIKKVIEDTVDVINVEEITEKTNQVISQLLDILSEEELAEKINRKVTVALDKLKNIKIQNVSIRHS
ncbi:DUF1700 domain-containing protein [Mycoplasmatota bacterium WC44]